MTENWSVFEYWVNFDEETLLNTPLNRIPRLDGLLDTTPTRHVASITSDLCIALGWVTRFKRGLRDQGEGEESGIKNRLID